MKTSTAIGAGRAIMRITVPYNEVIRQMKLVKSRVTSRHGRYIRPIYDQIREHVKKHLLNISEGALFLCNYDASKFDYFVH